MRHRVAGRHLSRTLAHQKALRRNMAQSLFQYGEVRTTLAKAKEVRPFVERLITLARQDTLHSRQRLISLLGDRALIERDDQEKYDAMSDSHRRRVRVARTGRRHRAGKVPVSYNKKKIPFVAGSVVHKLIHEIAPAYKDRPGGYTRIIRLPQWRIGDNSDLAILQLVGKSEESAKGTKKATNRRRQKSADRRRLLEGRELRRRDGGRRGRQPEKVAKPEAPAKETEEPEDRPSGAADQTDGSGHPEEAAE